MSVGPDRVRIVGDESGADQEEEIARSLRGLRPLAVLEQDQAQGRSWSPHADSVDRVGQVGVFDHVGPIQRPARLALWSGRSRPPVQAPSSIVRRTAPVTRAMTPRWHMVGSSR